MSELEPTSTELGPTATECLRALLDERGVEYELTAWSCGAAVWWRDSSGTMWRAHDNEEDELLSFYAYNSVTPEQAIAATLGSSNCSNNCTNGERTSDVDATGGQMSITDELRKWVMDNSTSIVLMSYPPKHEVYGTREALLDIADRIDAEYERVCKEQYACSAPHGFIELPKDADGVPIRVGDVIAYRDNTKPKEVVALVPPSVVMVEDGPRYADMCRHYHAPTVEDVLRECCHKYHSLLIDDMNDAINGVERDYIAPDEIIAEFAAKLRLAGDAE